MLTASQLMEVFRETVADHNLMEDKVFIAKLLGCLLATTRQFSDLDYCEYIKEENGNEYVMVIGCPNEKGYRWKYKCNVTWDSGIAMIRDVLKQIS